MSFVGSFWFFEDIQVKVDCRQNQHHEKSDGPLEKNRKQIRELPQLFNPERDNSDTKLKLLWAY